MPFEFNGKPPALGSTSGAFNTFRLSETPPTAAIPHSQSSSSSIPALGTIPAFGAVSSFGTTSNGSGTTSTFGATSTFGTTSFTPSSTLSSQRSTASNNITAPADFDTILLDQEREDDTLSQALYRAKVQRPAVIGDVAKAADGLIREYLAKANRTDGSVGDGLRTLVNDLQQVGQTNPEAMRFLRYCFNRFTTPKVPYIREEKAAGVIANGSVEVHRDEAGIPIAFSNVPSEGPLVTAWLGHIQTGLWTKKWVDRANMTPAKIMVNQVAKGISKATITMNLVTRYGWANSSPGSISQEVVLWMDDLFEMLVCILKDWSEGWRVEGRDEASYFTSPSDHEQVAQSQPVISKTKLLKGGKSTEDAPCCPKMKFRSALTQYRSEFTTEPFPFMQLPPELRNRVYQYALAPGYVSLRSCAHHMPLAVRPRLAIGLLTTSRLINKETEGLLFQNRFIVNFLVYGGVRSLIHPRQMPLHVLPKITHLTMVVDCTELPDGRWGVRPNFRPLQGLTSLQSLRITALQRAGSQSQSEWWTEFLEEIVVRVPASCALEYESFGELENLHVEVMKIDLNDLRNHEDPQGRDPIQVDARVLRTAAQNFGTGVVRGSLSGVHSGTLPFDRPAPQFEL